MNDLIFLSDKIDLQFIYACIYIVSIAIAIYRRRGTKYMCGTDEKCRRLSQGIIPALIRIFWAQYHLFTLLVTDLN
jgi:hypothetical protein